MTLTYADNVVPRSPLLKCDRVQQDCLTQAAAVVSALGVHRGYIRLSNESPGLHYLM